MPLGVKHHLDSPKSKNGGAQEDEGKKRAKSSTLKADLPLDYSKQKIRTSKTTTRTHSLSGKLVHRFIHLKILIKHGNYYTDLQNYVYTWKRLSLEELKTLDIGTRLFDNAAFVRIHVMERFSEGFLRIARVERSWVSALADLMTCSEAPYA